MKKFLSENNINIASMNDGRRELGSEAFMVLKIDTIADDKTMKELQDICDVNSVRQIHFAK